MEKTNKPVAKKITSQDLMILKHYGKLYEVKVTLCWSNGGTGGSCFREQDGLICIHMRDSEFTTFDKALKFLKAAAREIYHPSFDENTDLQVA